MLISTQLPFKVFKTQHFVPTEQRVVVTEADAAHRVVREIDGWPAATVYARIAASASFGVATFPRDGKTGDELIAAADKALYVAKAAGRNRVLASPGTNGQEVGT